MSGFIFIFVKHLLDKQSYFISVSKARVTIIGRRQTDEILVGKKVNYIGNVKLVSWTLKL